MSPGGAWRLKGIWLGLLVLFGVASPVAGQTLVPIYNAANGHWYQVVHPPVPLSWHQARIAAEGMQFAGFRGHLATITSFEENRFIWHQVIGPAGQGRFDYLLGGYQDRSAPDYREPDGGWRWVTGEPFLFTLWGPPNPSNTSGIEDVLEYWRPQGDRWNDVSPAPRQVPYIVEYEPYPFPGGAVVQLFPAAAVGGTTVTGQISLGLPAGIGGTVVSLYSSHPAAAVAPTVVVVPQGATAALFSVVTFPVAVPIQVVITALGNGVAGSATLAVLPGGSVSPGVPTLVTVRAIAATQMEISWLDNSIDETAFEIHRRSPSGDWVWLALLAPNSTRFTDHTVLPGTTYLYRVRTQDARGASEWSLEAAGTTPP